jgi:hypothetical protein
MIKNFNNMKVFVTASIDLELEKYQFRDVQFNTIHLHFNTLTFQEAVTQNFRKLLY